MVFYFYNKLLGQLLTPGAIIFTGLQPLFMTADFLVLDAFDAQFRHVGVVTDPVGREFAFLFDEYIKGQAQHG